MKKKQLAPFVVIEGIDGCGKTTVVKQLKQLYPSAFFMREPGGTMIAELVREVLLSPYGKKLPAEQQMALFFAARRINIVDEILPDRQCGIPVISDRFDASTFAYQKCMRLVRKKLVRNEPLFKLFHQLRDSVVRYCEPTLYIYLEVDPKVGMERRALARNQKPNHFDTADLKEQSRRAASYREFFSLIETDKTRVVTVDANQPPEKVIADVVFVVTKEFEFKRHK